jgi:cytochrome oxidase assembly protein ShyY1
MALAALMFVIAVGCVVAGTWQISRFNQSVHDNDALKGNAHASAVPLTQRLVPLVGAGPAPGRDAIRYRTVTVSGRYVGGPPEFVGDEYLNGTRGFYVLSPLRVGADVLLVVRGFVPAASDGHPPAAITAAPTGSVQITGRLQTATTKHDDIGALGHREITAINPSEQSARLGAPVYDAYVTLNADQPGTAGLRVLAKPDLSNPAGGAYEAQHFAYIIQWYLFALIALVAPFAIARSEVREARSRFLGIDPAREEFGLEAAGEDDQFEQLDAGPSAGGSLVLRSTGAVVRRGEPTPEQWQHAQRLADRYGRSLGPDAAEPAAPATPPGDRGRRSAVSRDPRSPRTAPVANSTTSAHRSEDAYHGSYNDYLWQLALADGSTPTVGPSGPHDDDAPDELPQPPRSTPLMMRRFADEQPPTTEHDT